MSQALAKFELENTRSGTIPLYFIKQFKQFIYKNYATVLFIIRDVFQSCTTTFSLAFTYICTSPFMSQANLNLTNKNCPCINISWESCSLSMERRQSNFSILFCFVMQLSSRTGCLRLKRVQCILCVISVGRPCLC